MNSITEVRAKWRGEELITLQDYETQSWIIIAIHTLRNGRAAGGVRMKKYNNLDEATIDALNLSEAMTYKFAMCNMNWGGAKSVIYLTRQLGAPERRQLLLRFGSILKNLHGRYYAGPDVGTTSEDMDILYTTGKPYVFSRTVKAGGAGSSSIPTAFGVYAGIKTTCKFLFGTDELAGRTVFIQGLGSVGLYLQKLLLQENARIRYTETNQETIDLMSAHGQEVQFIPPDKCYETECDIFAPCAHGAILNANSIPQLKCKGVVGAANNQLKEPEDADRLKQRGILYAPDYVVNLGGAMGITSIEAEGVTERESIENVQKTISETLEEVYIAAKSSGTNTVDAAMQIAQKRLGHVLA